MVPADSRPSYEQLAHENAELRALVTGLKTRMDVLEAENAALRAENADLKLRLEQNSQNSSKPPSMDSAFTKPAPKSLLARAAVNRADSTGTRDRP